ncbi:MAG: site-specific DNA-methyltransferase [Saprospiraceae bacterium]|nr:site-specific DNA-methyltransferase [Saprospiraceae bacterium]
MIQQDFTNAGYSVVGTEDNENKLLRFLKDNYPSVIRDNEINLEELKTVLGLPVDEKVNGYGLNFVGRNFAKAKYAQKTDKELSLNTPLSKNIDTTQNLLLKGDNLESLKILKSHYNSKIKCIYIDPPYNTTNDEFVYPDKFDKEEAEVLGFQNLSQNDFDRLDFSFKSKKSHNGWLAFMYPRLLLARDLLSKDGVIFISIDDNEQANLKLLCDDVFGEENFVANMIWQKKTGAADSNHFSGITEYVLVYAKKYDDLKLTQNFEAHDEKRFRFTDEYVKERGAFYYDNLDRGTLGYIESLDYGVKTPDDTLAFPNGRTKQFNDGWRWKWGKEKFEWGLKNGFIELKQSTEKECSWGVYYKIYMNVDNEGNSIVRASPFKNLIQGVLNTHASNEAKELFNTTNLFSNPKPIQFVKFFANLITDKSATILDFFAGSGTTGHAVMQLNAEDGGNRKFILCQIDEPIKKDKPAYQFCVKNNLPPVISSITVERLKRAGKKIAKEIEEANVKSGMFKEDKKQVPDIGFKVFDSVEAPKLKVDETTLQISMIENGIDALSRIYNMIFTIGLDEPTQVPEEVVKDCIYKIGSNYYITNSENVRSDDYTNAIKSGKVFIDGWTASLNGTLQHYKDDVNIVF